MWDFDYQRARAAVGKKLQSVGNTCCENCFLGLFKHLIHLFIIAIVLAFVCMSYIVIDQNTDVIGYERSSFSLQTNQINQNAQMLDQYISHHPLYYGLNKMGVDYGYINKENNITDGLLKLSLKH